MVSEQIQGWHRWREKYPLSQNRAPGFRRSMCWQRAALMERRVGGRSVLSQEGCHQLCFGVAHESGKAIHYREESEVFLCPALNFVLLFRGGRDWSWRRFAPTAVLLQAALGFSTWRLAVSGSRWPSQRFVKTSLKLCYLCCQPYGYGLWEAQCLLG